MHYLWLWEWSVKVAVYTVKVNSIAVKVDVRGERLGERFGDFATIEATQFDDD